MKDKLKSWALWISLASLITYVILTVFKIDLTTQVSTIMNLLLPVLIGFGIINNPNDRGSI